MEVKRLNNELYHHGIKGQRWGVRRYQNPDGSLTPRGRKKLEKFQKRENAALDYRINDLSKRRDKDAARYEKKILKLHEKGTRHLIKKAEKAIDNNTGYDWKTDKKFLKIAEKEDNYKNLKKENQRAYEYAINRVNTAKDTISKYTLDDIKNEKSGVNKKNLVNGGRIVKQYYDRNFEVYERMDSVTWAKDSYRSELAKKNRE